VLSDDFGIILRVAIAIGLGAVLGFERELVHKPAGLRTHVLVAASACFLVQLGELIITQFAANAALQPTEADPIRILQTIIIGLSVLGTGTIWQNRETREVEGLTTAASLLFTGALGIAVALDRLLLAVGLTILALLAVLMLRVIERQLELKQGR
jgi:putative Mg2+ transporter-C (MgtC) family protein